MSYGSGQDAAVVGDHVVLTWWIGDKESTLDGWLLRASDGFVVLAASPDDDGSDDPHDDWWRATFDAAGVQVSSCR